MLRYIVRRLLQMVLAFFCTTFIVYSMMFATGDPLTSLAGEGKELNDAVKAKLTRDFHLDEPFLVRYWYYIKGLLTFDLGDSLSQRPIAEILSEAWGYTIQLASIAFVFVVILGVVGGVIAGMRRGGVFDNVTLFLTLVVIGIPSFVIGLMLSTFPGGKWGWFTPGYNADQGIATLIVPGFVLGALALATAVRLTRTSVAENLRSDYVRTAKAKGLKKTRIIGVHVLRNSLIPVVTFLGIEIGNLMGGAIVTERIFNIPGVGFQLFKGIQLSDGPIVVTIVSVLVVVYLLANLLVDILYAVLDPRIRYS
ncbi:ABC transporter permease [Longispora fulva]|uniref:ABC-type dipeptide/oligopeptide/nickel transport system permease component n=1 Tax=Longispora fulva TaxID=619741 RepID=A0A8J7GY10_9ACTN|nr:ABC transporter permease [Longispora fulva]MBG6140191.1 ABC-type dipeptide/oligopeptide/nickel transport system permease component [Longispora fulva]GIG57432.1 ABC transporter permease [Longispora fulva]